MFQYTADVYNCGNIKSELCKVIINLRSFFYLLLFFFSLHYISLTVHSSVIENKLCEWLREVTISSKVRQTSLHWENWANISNQYWIIIEIFREKIKRISLCLCNKFSNLVIMLQIQFKLKLQTVLFEMSEKINSNAFD